jgi:hypothetical protein
MVHTRKGSGLAPVSRRAVLGGLAAPLLPTSPVGDAAGADPVLPLWAEWRRAYAQAEALAAAWGSLEARLMHEVGAPRVAVPAPDGGASVWVTTHADIDAFLAERDDRSLGPHLHTELAERLAFWRNAAASLGLDETERLLDAALSRGDDLAESLIRIPAGSLAGAIAKLELILRTGEARADDDAFPFGWLRRAIADLRRLAAAGEGVEDLTVSAGRQAHSREV